MGVVLVVEVHRSARLDRPVDAGDFQVEQRLQPAAGCRERQLLHEAERIGEVLQDVPADDQVRPKLGEVDPRVKQGLPQFDRDAIRAGGSSLRNYVSADGSPGYFQLATMCYDREGLPCRVCKTPIRAIRQGQRSTFFCPRCQK